MVRQRRGAGLREIGVETANYVNIIIKYYIAYKRLQVERNVRAAARLHGAQE